MKKLFIVFASIAGLLSNVMCAHVAYEYVNILWEGKYFLTSAPAEVAFLLLIPYLTAIAVFTALAAVFYIKSSKKS